MIELEKQEKIEKKFLYLAPMMKRTDRHFRYLARIISPNLHLFTEMIPVEMLIYGNREKALKYSSFEKPVAIQLGGSNPESLSKAAEVSAARGYDEINLNCGCPSRHVLSGSFGAYMMQNPKLTAICVEAMRIATPEEIPISVKIRLGIDNLDSYGYLRDFVGRLIEAGAGIVHVHARKAMIRLTPKKNRTIPPINYAWVYKLKAEYKKALITVNGEISSVCSVKAHLSQLDGVMIGRYAYARPLELIDFDRSVFTKPLARKKNVLEIINRYLNYAEKQMTEGASPRKVLQHLFNLFHDRPYAKCWRQLLAKQISTGTIKIEELQAQAGKLA
ncbi:MAG: tRNA dihydrouridine(20/20a) synthase DusA [Pseudomonadota bacterium]|nr:tRNA dihydrouridine(20/20a) synthase DusA [Pseudomonadota bacterium]